jgi:AcrR family transcriptional regulator
MTKTRVIAGRSRSSRSGPPESEGAFRDGTVPAGTGSSRAGTRRGAYHHGDLSNALADAATELARGGGPEAVVLREAARRVGVSAAAAYRHYASHCELLQAVKDRAVAELASALQQGLDHGVPLSGPADEALRRLRNLGSAYIGFALANPGLFHAAFVVHSPYCRVKGIAGDVKEQLAAARPYQILSDALDQLVAVGLLDPARRELAPIAFWSSVHGLATLILDGPLAALTETEQAGAISHTLDILADGIRCSSS